ncbi:Smr/MutS family protein [Mycoplasma sp. Mirounga ES2805-ORL]|uniref:Smr/MutS family protein n=1 Tax=Mycoplasma sp. Mirounga ES2805-ORL TaxID=754514 RepID=UPI00197C74C2|nr:Smr/MutS family protein [Mycoplasma sp. Mirounga ES2805-ORL]QSF13696.1 Smr/MutS family protein [Mycoplasma sp. Mirounga ES2805-ORL]
MNEDEEFMNAILRQAENIDYDEDEEFGSGCEEHFIDLHGMSVNEAVAAFELALIETHNRQCKSLTVIVGHGTKTLKTHIEDILIRDNLKYTLTKNKAGFRIKLK